MTPTFQVGNTKYLQIRARILGSRSQLSSLSARRGRGTSPNQPRVLSRTNSPFFTRLKRGSKMRGCPIPRSHATPRPAWCQTRARCPSRVWRSVRGHGGGVRPRGGSEAHARGAWRGGAARSHLTTCEPARALLGVCCPLGEVTFTAQWARAMGGGAEVSLHGIRSWEGSGWGVSMVAFCWGIVGSIRIGRCVSQAVDLTHPRAGGRGEPSRRVWGGGGRTCVRLRIRWGRGDCSGCPGGKLDLRRREGATLKGTGHSEGEGSAPDQMVSPFTYWTLRSGDPRV